MAVDTGESGQMMHIRVQGIGPGIASFAQLNGFMAEQAAFCFRPEHHVRQVKGAVFIEQPLVVDHGGHLTFTDPAVHLTDAGGGHPGPFEVQMLDLGDPLLDMVSAAVAEKQSGSITPVLFQRLW